jgi:hypothetical protein
MVEFALIFPVFLLITLGVVDLTRVFTAYISLTNGVREAAIFAGFGDGYSRWCSSAGSIACPTGSTGHEFADPDNIAYRIEGEASGLDLSQIVVDPPACFLTDGTATTCDAANSGVVRTTIRASYSMPVLTPVLGAILGNNVPMSAATTVAIIR